MSGLMNKVKDALSGDKNNTAEAEANKGPHDYHHDHSSTSGGTGSYGANPTHGGLDQSSTSRDPMHSGRDDMTGRSTDTSGYGSHSTGSTTTGPHSSSLANKADPRVDSDRDGSGYGRDTTGSGLTGSGTHGSSGLGRTTGGSGLTGGSSDYDRTTGGSGLTGSNTSGPHSSSMANKADPRVDSDRDGRRGVESGSGTTGSGMTGSGMTGSGITGHHDHHGETDIVHGGEHHTTTANRLDPHISGGRGPLEHATVEGGSGLGGSSTGGYGSSTGTTSGPHSSSMANKADPRVDSDLDGRRGVETGSDRSGNTGGYGSSTGTTGGYGSSTGGTGYNDNTSSTTGTSGAGPHNSGMMNKLDPRVDSDRDGSRMK